MKGALTDLFCLLQAFLLALVVRKICLTTDISQALCLHHRKHSSLCHPSHTSLSCVQGQESYVWHERSTTNTGVSQTSHTSRQQRDSGWSQGQLMWGQGLSNAVPLRSIWAGALFHLCAGEEVACPSPRKLSHDRRRKGSCQLTQLSTEGSSAESPSFK